MITLEEFFALHPRLYHMAWKGAWESITTYGLLSTEALLDLYEIQNTDRDRLLSAQRKNSEIIEHPKYGTAIIRDQKPMPDSKLSKCLNGSMGLPDWHRMLNGKVFFWTTKSRLKKLMLAGNYRNDDHCVLVLDTKKLYTDYAESVTFAPINSGAITVPNVQRGPNTFTKFADFPYREYVAKRPKKNDILVEFTVNYRVTDIQKYLVAAYIMNTERVVNQLYPSTPNQFDWND